MEIFNLFVRRFLTIKFNDDVINKSGKNSLIPWEFLFFPFTLSRGSTTISKSTFAWRRETWEARNVELN